MPTGDNVVSETPSKQPIMWVNGEIVGKSFKPQMALHRGPNNQYEARPLFLDASRVPLHTTSHTVAVERCEKLYDMLRSANADVAAAAATGFMLIGEGA